MSQPTPALGSEVYGFDASGTLHALLVVTEHTAVCVVHAGLRRDGGWTLDGDGTWCNANLGKLIPAGAM